MRPIYEKFTNGEPLTDAELKEGVKFFNDLTNKLSSLGPVFRLAATEAHRVARALEGFQKARQEPRSVRPRFGTTAREVPR